MIEAVNQKVEWPDTDEATFACFAQFVYTGKYDGIEQINQELVQTQREDELGDGVDFGADRENERRMFERRCHNFQCSHDGVCWDESKDPAMYTDTLMAHAQIYVFADYHGIDRLQALVLRQLHRLWVQFPLPYTTVGSILELVQYTSENTRPNREEILRCMVSAYGVCTLYHFQCDENVDLLMKSVPDFAKDITRMVIGCDS